MPALQVGTWSGTLASDNWRALLDLLSLPLDAKVYLFDAQLQAQLFGLTVRVLADGEAAPSGSTGDGIQYASGAGIGGVPTAPGYMGWPLHRVYVRNSTPGSNAKAVLTGTVALG